MIQNVASDAIGASVNNAMPNTQPTNNGSSTNAFTWVLIAGIAIIGFWYVKKQFIDKPAEIKQSQNK